MPSTKRTRRKAAIKRTRKIEASRQAGAVKLRGLDAAIAKLRARAQAGELLSPAQRQLLDAHGGTWPPSYD